MKRILLVTLATAFAVILSFMTVKFWGQGQRYSDYKHPLFALAEPTPHEFYAVRGPKASQILEKNKFIFLDVAITSDQKMVVVTTPWLKSEKAIRYSTLAEIEKRVINLDLIKDVLPQKIIIFNLIENAQAVHENFFEAVKSYGLEKGNNFIVMSPYEAPIRALKEKMPAFVYGTTQPEILKIVAMNSMYLVEATNIRADVIVHALKIKNQNFYNDELIAEFKRRHKKIIVGPLTTELEKQEAVKLSPYGLILEQ